MKGFLAIVRLTCRSAIRSNVFRFLLFLLIASVILVPNTLKGDGTAQGFIQVMLQYSTAFTAFILSVSVIWLSCSELCTDAENGQLHMIVVKPVSRVVVFAGKFAGVFLIHFVLLVIAFVFIYVFTMFQYARQEFTPQERARLENEVFTGRRAFTPYLGNLDEKVQKELARKVETAKKTGEALPELSGEGRRKYLANLKMEILSREGEVRPGQVRTWYYMGLPKEYNGPVYVGYKAYSGEVGSKNQKIGMGMWVIRYVQKIYDENVKDSSGKPVLKSTQEIPLQMKPEQILTSAYKEFVVPGDVLIHNGTASLGFVNLQSKGSETMYFQATQSPRLLIRESSFISNYIRAMFVAAMGLFVLGVISCSFAGFLSMPTAVFLTLSYILAGLFSSYLGANLDFSPDMEFLDAVGAGLAFVMSNLLISVQSFAVSDYLATGTLIEYGLMLHLFFVNMIIKVLPVCLLGVYLYYRRELALAMKQ